MTEGTRNDIEPNQMLAGQERVQMDCRGRRRVAGQVQDRVWAL